jgi:hypothetical protein
LIPAQDLVDFDISALNPADDGTAVICGVSGAGSVACWSLLDASALHAPAGADFVEIHTYLGEACARTVDGSVVCWRVWEDGAERAVHALAGTFDAIALNDWLCGIAQGTGACTTLSGEQFTVPGEARAIHDECVLTADGGIDCFDCSSQGCSTRPVLSRVGPFVSLDDGCAVRATDGTIECWQEDLVEAQGDFELPRGPFRSVSVGGYEHACGVTEEGRIACWNFGGPVRPCSSTNLAGCVP